MLWIFQYKITEINAKVTVTAGNSEYNLKYSIPWVKF